MARRSGHHRLMLAALLGLACSGCPAPTTPAAPTAAASTRVATLATATPDGDAGADPTCTSAAKSGPTGAPLPLLRPDWSRVKPPLSLPGALPFEGPTAVAPRSGGRPKLPPGAVARVGGGAGVGATWRISPEAKLFLGQSTPAGMAIFEAESRRRVAPIETGFDEEDLRHAKIVFLPDKPAFALYSKDDRPARVRIYSTVDGHLLSTHALPIGVRDLFFGTAGRRAALLFDEQAGQPVKLTVLELGTGAVRQHTMPCEPTKDRVVALAGDGNQLISSRRLEGQRMQLELVDLGKAQRRWRSKEFTGDELSFSPDGAWVAASGHVTSIRHAATGELAYARQGRLVAFAPDGRALIEDMGSVAERDFDGTVRVRFASPEHDYARHAVVTSAGKVVLATTMNSEMYWWERSTGRPILLPAARMHGVQLAFSHDDRELIGNDGEYLHRWNARTGLPIDRRRGRNPLRATDNGQLLLATRGAAALDQAHRAGVRATGLAENRSMRLSRDGSRLVVTTIGGSAADVVIDLRTGRVRPLQLLGGRLGLSPDGELLAQWQDPIRIVRSATGELVREIELKPKADVGSGEFSPDGKWLALLCYEAPSLWLARVDGQSPPRPVPAGDRVTAIAFSPNGRWLAVGHDNGTTDLRDPHTGQLYRQFTGHRGGIYSLAFSPDGSRLVTLSHDGTALVWRSR